MTATAPRRAFFAALGHRDFRVWWTSFLLATSSSTMQLFAVGWLLVQIATLEGAPERAPLYLGLLGLSRAVPAIVLGLFGGVAADRLDRRTLLVAAEGIFGSTTIVLALATLTGTVTLWVVLGAGALIATAASFYHPARHAILPRMVGERDLLSAIGLNGLALQVSSLTGPLIGGVLIIPFGVGGALLASGLGRLAVMGALLLLAPQPVAGEGRAAGVIRSLGEGLRYIRSTAIVFWLLIGFAATTLLARPLAEMLPAFARDVLRVGPVELSWLVAAVGVGSVLSSLVVANLRTMRRTGIATVAAIVAAGALLALFTRERELPASILTAAAIGFAMMFAASMVMVTIQTTTPDHLRGRVIAVQNLIVDGGMATGALLLGILGSVIGIEAALAIAGSVLVGAGVWIGLRPAVTRVPAALGGVAERGREPGMITSTGRDPA